jgi:hypothetical protein
MNKKLIAILLFITLSFFLFSTQSNAQEDAKLNFTVNHVASNIEKLGEKIGLLLKFSKESKVDNYLYLSEKRLAELNYVVENKQVDYVEPAASRYSTYNGVMISYVVGNKVTNKKNEVINTLERHIKITEKLRDKFEANSAWWLSLSHDINSAKEFEDKVKSI